MTTEIEIETKGRPAALRRRFTLLDGMILVGSAAFGLAATRWLDPEIDWGDLFAVLGADFTWDPNLFEEIAGYMLLGTMPASMAVALGLVALRFRSPRPRWRRLARQPGLVACLMVTLSWPWALAATIFCVLWTARFNALAARGVPSMTRSDFLGPFAVLAAILGGGAVAAAWATLLLVRAWRPEPSGLDRLGRLLGLGWIAMAAVASYLVVGAFPF